MLTTIIIFNYSEPRRNINMVTSQLNVIQSLTEKNNPINI